MFGFKVHHVEIGMFFTESTMSDIVSSCNVYVLCVNLLISSEIDFSILLKIILIFFRFARSTLVCNVTKYGQTI